MKSFRKAAEFLKKAVRALRGKAGVLRARLLFLASLRRRTAVVGTISHRIRALMSHDAAADHRRGRALAPPVAEDVADDEKLAPPPGLRDVAGLSELASLFQGVDDGDAGGGGCYPDWTHSMFDDDGEEVVTEEEVTGDEPSVMDVIRSRREGDGEEFNADEEIDNAADMFIRRVRSRMNHRSF